MINLPCKKPELYNYAPHKENMLLIDQVDNYDIKEFTINTSVFITPQSEFFNKENLSIPTYVSFEYMAQSIGILSGIFACELNAETKIGFILGIRDFIAHKNEFPENSIVEIFAKQIFKEGDISIFEGEAKVGDTVYSTATLTLAQANKQIIEKMNKTK